MNVPEYLIQVYINEHRIEKFESRLAKVGFVNINESKKKKKGKFFFSKERNGGRLPQMIS